jgi:hypothetical protein
MDNDIKKNIIKRFDSLVEDENDRIVNLDIEKIRLTLKSWLEKCDDNQVLTRFDKHLFVIDCYGNLQFKLDRLNELSYYLNNQYRSDNNLFERKIDELAKKSAMYQVSHLRKNHNGKY